MRICEEKAHAARIIDYAKNDFRGPAGVPARIRQSWQRTLNEHGIDPTHRIVAPVLSSPALRERRCQAEGLLRIADVYLASLREELAKLNYCILLTDDTGATIDLRNCAIGDADLERMNLRPGACWPEHSVGTGGIGTTLYDRAPILVHQHEHFSTQIIDMSCSAAPIFDAQGQMIGVLNATGLNRPQNRSDQGLVYNLIVYTATVIENAWFVAQHQDFWIAELNDAPAFFTTATDPMIAFDESGRIVAGNRAARLGLLCAVGRAKARSIDTLFDLRAESLIDAARACPGGLQPLRRKGRDAESLYYARVRGPCRKHGGASTPARSEPKKRAGGLASVASADPQVGANIARMRRIIDSRLPILLLGETGSGKEMFAHAVHEESQRRDKPFVAVNCAAIPETLIESELFGYKGGAFTGAKSKGEKGKLLQADGGTLFLDEIGDMPASLQTRLLRVLSEGEVLPLGSSKVERVDLSVICATHHDLAALVDQGSFRQDLYYRLNAATFRLPPLRERSDCEGVIRHVLAEEATLAQCKTLIFTTRALTFALAYPWPGNIRQLRNALRYAVAVADGSTIDISHFPPDITQSPPLAADGQWLPDAQPAGRDSGESSGQRERDRMIAALRHHGWQVSAAARSLGVARATFYRRMQRYKIVSPNLADAVRG